jgi:excisionase family DNA binding protein
MTSPKRKRRAKPAPVPADERLVLDVPEAAKLLNISRNAAYLAARRGDLPTVRVGGRILVPRAALLRMLDATVNTTAE